MPQEIERKFLTSGGFRGEATEAGHISLCYPCSGTGRTALAGAKGNKGNCSGSGASRFEADGFHGDNEGLVAAEMELGPENEEFARPDRPGKEVSGDRRRYNAAISKKPCRNWQTLK